MFGISDYTLTIELDGQNTTAPFIIGSPSSSAGIILSQYFDSATNVRATWCAEFSGSTIANYATVDIAMFRLVKSPGLIYSAATTPSNIFN